MGLFGKKKKQKLAEAQEKKKNMGQKKQAPRKSPPKKTAPGRTPPKQGQPAKPEPAKQPEKPVAEPVVEDVAPEKSVAESAAPEEPMTAPTTPSPEDRKDAENEGGEGHSIKGKDMEDIHLKERQISDLMTLEGIGRKRAEKLWAAGFTSSEQVADAALEELISVEGFSKKLAEAVKITSEEIELDDDLETASDMDEGIETDFVSTDTMDVGNEDDISSRLLQWSVDGFDIAHLESVPVDERGPDFIRMYEETAKAIDDIESIRSDLENLNILDLDDEFRSLIDVLSCPSRMEDIRKRFQVLKNKADLRDAIHELKPLEELESLAPRVRAVLSRVEAGEDLESLRVEIAEIKRAYKEDFFMSQFAEQISAAPPIRVKKAPALKKVLATPEAQKTPMEVEDIFLLHKKDYRLINHVTNRVIGDQEKTELLKELKAIRSFVRHNDRFRPAELNIIKLGEKVVLLQQGDHTMLSVVVRGDVNVWAKKLIGKVLDIIEDEEKDRLGMWAGDPEQLPSVKKNITALMYACARLGKQVPGPANQ